MKKQLAAVVAAALLLTGCGSNTPTTSVGSSATDGGPASVASVSTAQTSATAPAIKTFSVAGDVKLRGTYDGESIVCSGTGRFSAITEGAKVSVYAADGKLLGFDDIGPGVTNFDPDQCIFSWSVDNIPTGRGPYLAKIDSHEEPFGEPEGGREAVSVAIVVD